MTTNRKALGGGWSQNQLGATIKESAEQLWFAGLGTYSLAQGEGRKLLSALVEEGGSVPARTRKMADVQLTRVADTAVRTLDRFEKVVEDRVAHTLSALGVLSKLDIDRLAMEISELTVVVNEWAEENVE